MASLSPILDSIIFCFLCCLIVQFAAFSLAADEQKNQVKKMKNKMEKLNLNKLINLFTPRFGSPTFCLKYFKFFFSLQHKPKLARLQLQPSQALNLTLAQVLSPKMMKANCRVSQILLFFNLNYFLPNFYFYFIKSLQIMSPYKNYKAKTKKKSCKQTK